MTVTDIGELIIKFSVIVAGVWAVFTWYQEHKATREQRSMELAQQSRELEHRKTELAWRRMEAAKSLVDEYVADEGVNAACEMLDWRGLGVTLPSGIVITLTDEMLATGLEVVDKPPTEFEKYVKDSFDSLFYYMSVFEHWVSLDFVAFNDVRYPIQYYVPLLARHREVVERFIRRYNLKRAEAFLHRFGEWK